MGSVTEYADQLATLGKEIKDAGGPTKWVFARITEFLIGMAIGTVTGIADVLAESLAAVEESITYAGSQATTAYSTVGSGAIDAVDYVLDQLATAASWAGPLGPFVYLIVAAILLAIAWRVIRAVADSVPIASGIQTLLEGR